MTEKTGDTGDRSPRHTKIGSADLDLEATGLETEPNLQAGPGLKLEPDLRDGPFDIQGGGGWDFFEKNSLFRNRSEKNKMSSKKLKIKNLLFIQ